MSRYDIIIRILCTTIGVVFQSTTNHHMPQRAKLWINLQYDAVWLLAAPCVLAVCVVFVFPAPS